MEDLRMPYHLTKKEEKSKMKSFAYSPSEHGGLDFNLILQQEPLFSPQNYFKTVFASGGDMVAEEKAIRDKELETFNKKMVVDSKQFSVNTIVKKNHLLLKYTNIREDPAKKLGI